MSGRLTAVGVEVVTAVETAFAADSIAFAGKATETATGSRAMLRNLAPVPLPASASGSIAIDRTAVVLAADAIAIGQTVAELVADSTGVARMAAESIAIDRMVVALAPGTRRVVPVIGSAAGSRMLAEMVADPTAEAGFAAWPVSGSALIY